MRRLILAAAAVLAASLPLQAHMLAGILLSGAGGGGATGTTFNPSRTSANITLSGGNLTATANADLAGSTFGTTSATTGKKYLEFTVAGTGVTGDSDGIGFGNASAATSSGVGGDANSIGAYTDANVYVNGVSICTGTVFTTGDTVGLAIDVGAHLLWVRDPSGSEWNSNPSANPATGVGGCAFSAQATLIASALSPMINTRHNATPDSVTAHFLSTSWIFGAPAGFSQW